MRGLTRLLNSPLTGWLLVAAVVVGYDVLAIRTKHPTLSDGVHKAHRWTGWQGSLVHGLSSAITHHLFSEGNLFDKPKGS